MGISLRFIQNTYGILRRQTIHFVAKTFIIRKAIPKYQKFLEVQSTETFAEYFNKKNTETKLNALINLESKLTEIENKKEIFKQTKYDKYTKENLEE